MLRATGRIPPPTTVPRIPPAAAPITALFTLRPVTPPMIAPAAAPMPALCARLGDRRDVRGAGAGCSTLGAGLCAMTTSPPASVLAAVSLACVAMVAGSRVVGASAALPVLVLDVRAVRSLDEPGVADWRTAGVLVATRRATVGCACVTGGALRAGATGAPCTAVVLSIALAAATRTFDCDSLVTRWCASTASAVVGVSAR